MSMLTSLKLCKYNKCTTATPLMIEHLLLISPMHKKHKHHCLDSSNKNRNKKKTVQEIKYQMINRKIKRSDYQNTVF